MRIYHLFIGCAIAFLLQSCYKNDPFPDVEDEHARKKVEVFLEGNQDEIYPCMGRITKRFFNGDGQNGESCLFIGSYKRRSERGK